MDRCLFILLLTICICSLQAPAQDYIWWEAEKPLETNFPPTSPFDISTFPDRANQLSGNDWLSSGGKRGKDILYAKYQITVPKSGRYSFWTRKFWTHGPFRWHFDQSNWQIGDASFGMSDDTPLRKFVDVNWVWLGKADLAAGVHPMEIQLLAREGEDTAAGFDCFVLTPGIFVPNGKLKPGEKSNLSDPGYFPFEPASDPFTSDCLLDLRYLNEVAAGQNGFIKRAGDHFTLADGTPVRFWGVNVTVSNINQDRASIDYLARKLAKLGVNMVRFHGPLYDKSDPTKIDPKQLDNLFYLVAAMKREGIYTYLSFYYPLWVDASNPKLALRGYEKLKNKNPFAILYFDPPMQQIYRSWATQLLNTPNPYTSLTLARDPALAIVEIVNEDSLFFWTFSQKDIPPPQWKELEDQYSDWLQIKYGSIANASRNWGWRTLPQDSSDHAGLYEAYGMTREGADRFGIIRIADQVRFLAETQRRFYNSTVRFFKDGLHVGGLVNASNWITADQAQLGAIDRWTLGAADMIDQHGYLQPQVTGDGAGYSIRIGDTFTNPASVLNPAKIPLLFFKTAGYPQITSEIGWTNPNRYRTDSIFLTAAYASLQHIDGLFFFLINSNYLHDSTMTKFGISTPTMAAAFPAAALLYRRGDITSPPPVMNQFINIDDQLQLKTSGEEPDADLAAYIGPVTRTFGHQSGNSSHVDLPKYIDRNAKTLSSVTGQLHWNYATGIATMNTPLAQGAAGLLSKAGKIELDDTTIECKNEFAAIFIVSLDGQPLKVSKKILIQATTQEQPYHFKTEPDGKGGERILDLGQYPFGVRKILATIAIKNSASDATVTSLEENGYAGRASIKISRTAEGQLRFVSPQDSIYQILSRN